MNNPAIIYLARAFGTDQQVELLPDINDTGKIGQIVCGLLNTSGGYIAFGHAKKGKFAGHGITEKMMSQLEAQIHKGISPKALISFQWEEDADGKFPFIEVPAGKDVPYAWRDVIYMRENKATRKADAATIRDIILRRQIEPERWERRFSLAEMDSDIDYNEVKAALDDAQKARRAFFRDPSQIFMLLEDFHAAKYGRVTNAGDVLFAGNPAARLPQTRIHAVCFSTDKAGDKFSDMKTLEGPLRRIFEEAYTFVVRNTPTIARFIRGNPKRQDSPLYPEDAVREALINALVHRDYSASSGGVSIHIFPRRMEIWNSGSLPKEVTVADLQNGRQLSVLRNPDIAQAIHMRGLMEKIGRGSRLMTRLCKEAALPPPTWESGPGGVTVTFSATDATIEAAIGPAIEVATDVGTDVTTDVGRLILNISGAMSRNEIRLRMRFKSDEPFRKNWLRPALKAGLLEMTIPDKPKSVKQRYRLTEKGEALKARLASAQK